MHFKNRRKKSTSKKRDKEQKQKKAKNEKNNKVGIDNPSTF